MHTRPNGGFPPENKSSFLSPRPLFLPLPCKCYVCTRCFKVVSVASNLLITCSPFWRSLLWYENAFCSQARKNCTWKEREIFSPWWTLKWHKTIHRKILICTIHSTQWMHTFPLGVFLENKILPFYHLCFSFEGVICCSPAKISVYTRYLKRVSVGKNQLRTSSPFWRSLIWYDISFFQNQGKAALSMVGWYSPNCELSNDPNQEFGTSYLQSIFYSVNTQEPQLWFSPRKWPLPFYHIGLSSKEGSIDANLKMLSVLQVFEGVSVALTLLRTCYPFWRRLPCLKMPFFK